VQRGRGGSSNGWSSSCAVAKSLYKENIFRKSLKVSPRNIFDSVAEISIVWPDLAPYSHGLTVSVEHPGVNVPVSHFTSTHKAERRRKMCVECKLHSLNRTK
jgi:hypothetical protein